MSYRPLVWILPHGTRLLNYGKITQTINDHTRAVPSHNHTGHNRMIYKAVSHTSLRVRNRVRFSPEMQNTLHRLGYPRAFDHWEVCDVQKGEGEPVLVMRPPNKSGTFVTVPVNSAVFSPGVL